MNNNFNEDLTFSEMSVGLICDWINKQKASKGAPFKARSEEQNYALVPYDILVEFETGEKITIEVKAVDTIPYHGGIWQTFFAEIGKPKDGQHDMWDPGSISSYIKSHKQIDFIVYHYLQTDELYFYDCSKFARYVWNNRSKSFWNKFGSISGIKFDKEEQKAGFIEKFSLNPNVKNIPTFEYMLWRNNKYNPI